MDKIIQIIPAPPGMFVKWKGGKGESDEYSPIVCLALIEDGHGDTFVSPLTGFEDGVIETVDDCDNFGGIVYTKKKEWPNGN